MTLYEVMRYCRNFFPAYHAYNDTWTIEGGVFDLPFLEADQHYLVEGSSFNDGVYQNPASGLHDETFTGYITPLNPPPAFLALVERMTEWERKFGAVDSPSMSPYQSESFGGYSYNKGSGSNGNATVTVWDAFKNDLNRWRKH